MFTYLLYLHMTRITINNGTPHLKITKEPIQRAALGRPAIKLLGGGGWGGEVLELVYWKVAYREVAAVER